MTGGALQATLIAAIPQLFVSDIAASCAFFADKLGFVVEFAYGEPPFYAQVKRGGAQIARRVVEILTARRALMSKIIVVDDDVDVFNMAAVLHAFATKCHPVRGTHIHTYEGRANALTPAYSLAERVARSGATVAFDSTWPPEWPRETTPIRATLDSMYSREVQEKVRGRYEALGL